jgi:O-antigen ligase
MRNTGILGVVATVAVVLSPVLMLSLKGGTGYCYFVVFALSLVYLSRKEHRSRAAELYRRHRSWVWAMVGLPAVVLFQIIVPRTGAFPALDPLLRLALVVPSFFFLASLGSRQLRLVQWGFALGALWTGAWALHQQGQPNLPWGPERIGNWFTNPIPFGDTALVLGFLAITSLRRDASVTRAEAAIKIAALLSGCYASYASGSRGGWIAIPLLIWAAVSGRHWLVKARLPFLCLVLACAGAAASTSIVRERIADVGADIKALQRGDSNTSTGIRLDLWRASVHLYLDHPVLGVGRGRLESAMRSLVQRNEGPEMIINGRAHNEFFSVLAETGTVGVVALLFLYAGTFKPFWVNRRSDDAEIACASYLGMALVGSLIIFGLTIDVLTLVMNAAFFALTAATLLAWIEARKREIASGI